MLLTHLEDGLYRVVTRHFVAGFVVRNGVVKECAPILRRKLTSWAAIAEWVNYA